MKALYTIPALLLLVSGCSGGETPAAPVDAKAIEAAAHGGYVAAINSNNVDTLMEGLTDDVVLQAPGAPEIIGKAAVREWVGGYFGAYETKWEKTSLGFTVTGDLAVERYTTRHLNALKFFKIITPLLFDFSCSKLFQITIIP